MYIRSVFRERQRLAATSAKSGPPRFNRLAAVFHYLSRGSVVLNLSFRLSTFTSLIVARYPKRNPPRRGLLEFFKRLRGGVEPVVDFRAVIWSLPPSQTFRVSNRCKSFSSCRPNFNDWPGLAAARCLHIERRIKKERHIHIALLCRKASRAEFSAG